MTADDQIICGYRETRTDGNYECVGHPNHHGQQHRWVKLNVKPAEVMEPPC